MIIGIGSDLTDIRRIEETLARFGKRFESRVFTAGERAKAQKRSGAGPHVVAGTYAKRFAAKEACAKALGLGIRGISWQEMEVVSQPSGAPSLLLHGKALAQLQRLTPPGMRPSLHLSLTDEYPLAQAFVVISADPAL